MSQVEAGFIDDERVTATDHLVELGPGVTVHVGFDPAFTPGKEGPSTADFLDVSAIVDTGATESCIDSDLAKKLNLTPVDRRKGAGIGGVEEFDFYLAQMHISALEFGMHGEFMGVHLARSGLPHRAILGRDFLQHHVMTYNGPTGKVSIST